MSDISQSIVASRLRFDGVFTRDYYKFTDKSRGEQMLNVSPHLAKLLARA